VALVLLSAAVLGLTWLCWSLDRRLGWWERSDPLREHTAYHDGYASHWRHNGRKADDDMDRDGTGIYEEQVVYNREGRPLRHYFDGNENGMFEVLVVLALDGSERYRLLDEDEDGIFEKSEYLPKDGVQERWLDTDQDGAMDRQEFFDVRTGEVLDAFVDRGRQGFVRER
jgi:hypothetical protein